MESTGSVFWSTISLGLGLTFSFGVTSFFKLNSFFFHRLLFSNVSFSSSVVIKKLFNLPGKYWLPPSLQSQGLTPFNSFRGRVGQAPYFLKSGKLRRVKRMGVLPTPFQRMWKLAFPQAFREYWTGCWENKLVSLELFVVLTGQGHVF